MLQKQLSLVDELARTILTPALRKGLFSKPYIPFRRYLGCYQMAFETGVVLGHMFCQRMPTFARLFSMPGREEELTGALQELARSKHSKARDADSLIGLGMFEEENRIKTRWQQSGVTEKQIQAFANALKMEPEQAQGCNSNRAIFRFSFLPGKVKKAKGGASDCLRQDFCLTASKNNVCPAPLVSGFQPCL